MKLLFIMLILASSCLRSVGEEARLWHDNKLTPEQPFPARVRAVWSGWEGCFLLLEEVGGAQGRLCIAKIRVNISVDYTVVQDVKAEENSVELRKKERWIYLSPGIEVKGFSWSIGAYTLGDRFGDEDILTKTVKYMNKKKAEESEPVVTPNGP
jgi:hypothetical protein